MCLEDGHVVPLPVKPKLFQDSTSCPTSASASDSEALWHGRSSSDCSLCNELEGNSPRCASTSASLTPWDESRYELLQVLYQCRCRPVRIELHQEIPTGVQVVVKRFARERLCDSPSDYLRQNPGDLEDPWQELWISEWLCHTEASSRICQCLGTFQDSQGDALLVTEWLPHGDLFTYSSNLGVPGPEREAAALPVLLSLLEAVVALHQIGVAHCDISSENALLKPTEGGRMELVLLDFAQAVTCNVGAVTGLRGKAMYRAPEQFSGGPYDGRAADLFSCGVVAYALAIGAYPWMSTAPGACKAFMYARANGLQRFFEKRTTSCAGRMSKISIARCLSSEYLDVLKLLLSEEPAQRFGAVDLLRSIVAGRT